MNDIAPRLAAGAQIYDTIARSHPSLLNGKVHCGKCGKTRQVDAARCLREGWPKCCSGTMSLDEPKDSCGNG